MKKLLIPVCLATMILSCNHTVKDTNLTEVQTASNKSFFKEGTIEMGIYSNDLDLGLLIDKIDFSRNDAEQQLKKLSTDDPESKAILDLMENIADQNPLAALSVATNIAECTYYIKDDQVLGKVRGFGWTMDNYHNQGQDLGSLYLETLCNTEHILEEDRQIYSTYKPSTNKGSSAINNIDFKRFKRTKEANKQDVSGYECDVISYTSNDKDPILPNSLQKLVVYTSALFNPTINFTHPFYLEETSGILRLDIYIADDKTPTLVMKPKSIVAAEIDQKQLLSRTANPVYTSNDMNWGFKALAIIMSGWGFMEE